MFVQLDGERFEAALIDRTCADSFMRRVPTRRMRERQPLNGRGEIVVADGPGDEMPVVRHDDVGEQSQREPFSGFGEQAFEGEVVAVAGEDRLPADRPVEDMEEMAASGKRGRRGMLGDFNSPNVGVEVSL